LSAWAPGLSVSASQHDQVRPILAGHDQPRQSGPELVQRILAALAGRRANAWSGGGQPELLPAASDMVMTGRCPWGLASVPEPVRRVSSSVCGRLCGRLESIWWPRSSKTGPDLPVQGLQAWPGVPWQRGPAATRRSSGTGPTHAGHTCHATLTAPTDSVRRCVAVKLVTGDGVAEQTGGPLRADQALSSAAPAAAPPRRPAG